MSRPISGCSGHSDAASRTTAVLPHGASPSRHTSPSTASAPCQPCAARSTKVSASVNAIAAVTLAPAKSPELTRGDEDSADRNPTRDTSPKCPLSNGNGTKWWKRSCTNLLWLPQSRCKQVCATVRPTLSWWVVDLQSNTRGLLTFTPKILKNVTVPLYIAKDTKELVILSVHASVSGTFN